MKRSKPKQRGLAVLAILLVATSLAATVTGLVLKAQLQKYVGGWEDRLAIAVPFMLLHDNTDLRRMEQARQAGSTPNQPSSRKTPRTRKHPTNRKFLLTQRLLPSRRNRRCRGCQRSFPTW